MKSNGNFMTQFSKSPDNPIIIYDCAFLAILEAIKKTVIKVSRKGAQDLLQSTRSNVSFESFHIFQDYQVCKFLQVKFLIKK